MQQFIVLCLLTVNVIDSYAKIANDTALRGLSELLKDGIQKPKNNVDLLPDAIETGMRDAHKPVEGLIIRMKIIKTGKNTTLYVDSNHTVLSNSTPIVFRIRQIKPGPIRYPAITTASFIDAPATQTPNTAEFDKIDDCVTELPDREKIGEGLLAQTTPYDLQPKGMTGNENDRFLEDYPNSYSEDSRDRDDSKKYNDSGEVLLGDQTQQNANAKTPSSEDLVHSVSIADLVLNFRKVKPLRSGSNHTHHRHHHHRHSKPHNKPGLRSRLSEKSLDEPNVSMGRNAEPSDLRDELYQAPDGYIVEEAGEYGGEFIYPNNNVLNINYRSVIPARGIAIPPRTGCLQCRGVPIPSRKIMNPPMNHFYRTLTGR